MSAPATTGSSPCSCSPAWPTPIGERRIAAAGGIGRESGEVRSEGLGSSGGVELDEVINCTTFAGTTVCIDEWRGYGRLHLTVDHSGSKWQWAMELDDGVRELHCNRH